MPRRRGPRFGTGFTPLEDRSVPTVFGTPWPDPQALTLSFAPDGTPTPTGPSALTAALSGAPEWKREVLRAYQTWAVHGNVNIALTADGGQPLGTPGAVQGDGRFGDVRVAAAPAGADTLAAASPFTWTGSTHHGDLVFNSTQRFGAGGYDVFSVAVHEAGHSFGLGHADHADSVMGESYQLHAGLDEHDIEHFQELYGTRLPDPQDAAGGNDTLARAGRLAPVAGTFGLRSAVTGDLTTLGDVDVYRINTLTLGVLGFTARVRAKGISLLTPALTVLDGSGRPVAFSATTDPFNNDVSVTVTRPLFGTTYYLKVDNATADVFGVGTYQVVVDQLAIGVTLPPLVTTLLPVLDRHTNDTLAGVTDLVSPWGGPSDSRFDYLYRGSVEDRADTDFYRVESPASTGSAPLNLNVLVWATDPTGLTPRVRVYDADQRPVAFQVLSNDDGLMSVLVPDAAADSRYYVQVSARTPAGARATGAYVLGVDFNRQEATTLTGVGGGTVTAAADVTNGLTVTTGGVFHFGLAASVLSGGGGVLSLTVSDAAGNVVFTLASAAGQPLTTRTQYLAAGAYTVRYQYTPAVGAPDAGVRFGLFLDKITDEMGPRQSSVRTTSPPPPPPPMGYDYSGSSDQTNGTPYYM